MSNDPNTLKISIAEEINMRDVPPGASAVAKEEMLPKDEAEKRQKIMLEYTRLSGRYCPPHAKKARWVELQDLPRVLADGRDMVAMCNLPRGNYSGISALSHVEIEDKDPLRFFVLPNGLVVINPMIVSHTQYPVTKDEGCMMYPENDVKKGIERFNKVTVIYQTLARENENSDPIVSKPVTEHLSGGPSHVFQHECSHLNGANIFSDDFVPQSSVGFGDGSTVDEQEVLKMYKYEELERKENQNG